MDEGSDRLTPAEERLLRLLALLQIEAESAHASLQQPVMHRVRLQLFMRQIGQTIAELAGTVLDGLALVIGFRTNGKEKEH
jgi:hypothetical protein